MKNKGMYRLLSGVLCTSVLLSSQVYAAAPADYSDFPQNWSKDAMEFAVKNNFITGVSEDKIAPKAALTRAQLAAILSRVMKTGAGDVSVLDNFNDADKNAWYAGSMAKVVELNILYGDGDSIYPDRPVTRQELFTILVRAFSVAGGDESALAPYSDAGSVSSWARAAISAMIAQGYAAGYEDKTIRPTQQVTREEFAQLLYRMQEFYGSSDSSDDKTETKTDEPTKTDGKKTSGGGGGGSSSGGGSHSGGSTVTANTIVDEAQAKVQSLAMGTWLPLVFKDGFNTENVTVTVDGTNVTSAMSKVTTDGTIAKLPLTGTPKQVVIKSGDKTQTINLSGNGTASVYTNKTGYLPQYVLAHGAVAAWDYHLTNYDDKGNVRYTAGKTTFDTKEAVNPHPYYSPDAELEESNSNLYGVSGTVTIMFNYNTAAEKEWFDGINNLELVQYDEGKSSLNSSLNFDRKSNQPHGTNTVGKLEIPIGQSNFYSNGRYYVRVTSKDGDKATVLVPIHVVNATAPTMTIKEQVKTGDKVYFSVENMTYGITSPIESVTLKGPNDTEARELTYIDDYFLFGGTFVLYNDGTNNIPDAGNYTITIHSNGFKDFGTTFYVDGENVQPAKQAVVVQSAAYDVVTHATGSSSGSGSSDGGGSYMISANLLFDTDLLANALVLDAVGVENTEVTKVLTRWEALSGKDAVLNRDANAKYYNYGKYQAAVNQKKTTGAVWLPFAEYTESSEAVEDNNRPYAVKEVLEDGLLGETNYNGDYSKTKAPTPTVTAEEGSDVVLTFAEKDADYVAKISKIYINGNSLALNAEKYTVDTDALTITIDKSCFNYGKNTVSIETTDTYAGNKVAVEYEKNIEKDLSLKVTNEGTIKADDVITIEITGSEGDFLKNLKEVKLGERTVMLKGQSSSDDVYYVIADDKKSIELHQVPAGEHTLSLRADYYTDALTTSFTVVEKDAETVTTPAVGSYERKAMSTAIMSEEKCDYYRVFFTGDGLKDYLNAVSSVIVGEGENAVIYTKVSRTAMDTNSFRANVKNEGGSLYDYDVLDLAVSAIDASTENTVNVTIVAPGYDNVTFPINKTNGGGTTDPTDPDDGKLDAPAYTIAEKTEYGAMGNYPYYKVTFTGDNTREYVNNITAVTVQETEYNPASGTEVGEKSTSYMKETGWEDYLKLGTGSFVANGKTTVTIKATGYKDLVITYGTDATTPTEPTTKTAPEYTVATNKGTGAYGSYNYYEVTFDGNDASAYVNAITGVTVKTTTGTVTYEKSSTGYAEGTTYVNGGIMDSKILKLGEAGFDKDGKTTITITATGYEDLEIVYGDDATDTPEEAKYKVSSCELVDGRYRLMFDGFSESELKSFLGNITEVTVAEREYDEKTGFFWGSYNYSKLDRGYGVDSLELTADGFNTDDDTVIVIKGTLNGEEVTITFTYTAE